MLCLVSCHLLSLSPDRSELLEKTNTAKFSNIFQWEQTGELSLGLYNTYAGRVRRTPLSKTYVLPKQVDKYEHISLLLADQKHSI